MNRHDAEYLMCRLRNMDCAVYLKCDVSRGYSVIFADNEVSDREEGEKIAFIIGAVQAKYDDRIRDLEEDLESKGNLLFAIEEEVKEIQETIVGITNDVITFDEFRRKLLVAFNG